MCEKRSAGDNDRTRAIYYKGFRLQFCTKERWERILRLRDERVRSIYVTFIMNVQGRRYCCCMVKRGTTKAPNKSVRSKHLHLCQHVLFSLRFKGRFRADLIIA